MKNTNEELCVLIEHYCGEMKFNPSLLRKKISYQSEDFFAIKRLAEKVLSLLNIMEENNDERAI